MPSLSDPAAVTIMPALDTAPTISRVVEQVADRGVVPVVIDDGSTDGTAGLAEAAGATVLRHGVNRGKGHALVTGFRWALAAGATRIATMDADGQHDPDDLLRLLDHAGTADLVVGQRQVDRAVMPRASFIGNCISTFFVSLFCGRQLPDVQCGLRVYSPALLRQMPLSGGRFETETEILMRAVLLGLTIHWVPIHTIYEPDGGPHQTHFDTLRDTLRVIRVVVGSKRFPRSRR
jgi:glycosyltransferase involved in cell wall biosynthesis